jgi:uncharacterized protein (TIGR02145 family)
MIKKRKKLINPFIVLGILLLMSSCKKDSNSVTYVDHTGEKGTVSDIDGNVYATIGIGSQIWMAENLKVTHYRDGSIIPEVQDNNLWKNLTSGAFCSYNNDAGISAGYGLLYNWSAVTNNISISPNGWHIPTIDEWDTLINKLGGKSTAGSLLKESGNAHWTSFNSDATNESGFSALPGGWRINMGSFFYINERGFWWTKSDDFLPGSFAYSYCLYNDSTNIVSLATIQNFGLSVRCVKN